MVVRYATLAFGLGLIIASIAGWVYHYSTQQEVFRFLRDKDRMVTEMENVREQTTRLSIQLEESTAKIAAQAAQIQETMTRIAAFSGDVTKLSTLLDGIATETRAINPKLAAFATDVSQLRDMTKQALELKATFCVIRNQGGPMIVPCPAR